MDSSAACGFVLRHSLAYAHDLWRMVILHGESVVTVAKRLDLDWDQARGVCHLLSRLRKIPSKERLALIAMWDPGLEDADIAEIFGEDEAWAAAVRADKARLRQEEPIDFKLECLLGYNTPEDLEPDEILREAEDKRAGRDYVSEPVDIQSFSWDGFAFKQALRLA